MIPLAHLQAWSARAPWPDLRQIEQDLIISRALCDLFNAPALNGKIAFRGGTAIHKLLFARPLRYSEDIDLVQTKAEPIGATIDAIRHALITRAVAEQRMLEKLGRSLTEDIAPLLPSGVRFNEDDAIQAFAHIWTKLIARIAGDEWKLSERVIGDLRRIRHPKLLT